MNQANRKWGDCMPEYVIRGGIPLRGTVAVQGAKNSVLPILAASLLCENTVQLSGVPQLRDVSVSLRLLEKIGCRIRRGEHLLELDLSKCNGFTLAQEDCRKMRSSVLFLGALLGRFHKARLYFPGGCVLGERPIDLHIRALRQMGAEIQCVGDEIFAHCPNGLHGCEIHLSYPSVGATENILMAAALAKGTTVLYNGAREPEIEDLIDFLNAMGAQVERENDLIRAYGVTSLHGCHKRVMPDRIAAFTFLAAALATDGEITLENCPVEALGVPLEILAAAGGVMCRRGNQISIKRSGPFVLPVEHIISGPYPAFPTDAGAPIMALLALGQGGSVFEETVFSDRFKVVEQLCGFGADITVEGRRAYVNGVSKLRGCHCTATDLRAGAALLIAALAAEGRSVIHGGEHIIRGYENVVGAFSSLGANIAEK